ncbi:tRNA-uridine aminocarboxypropyltransferase [Celerinatantimonas sp. YJH-8]|uniref:tRNA-uridine aminocarboxypropyltransferase n=1 Tax=Celerinatantimonas sp. YJH-8 TaxID=3228714 RepID=UPI0038C6880B
MSTVPPHAIERLYQQRLKQSTRPYQARGYQIIRCPHCHLAQKFCQCHLKQSVVSNCAFCLIMYDFEVLKPSNSAGLIADIIPDTYGFIWSRMQTSTELLTLLANPEYQPIVIFPTQNALESQPLATAHDLQPTGKKPLFILLDGTWREAHKMYRKSPWLHHFPLLSFNLDKAPSDYSLRKGSLGFQLATAEVAALALAAAGEQANADVLLSWFEVFCEASLMATSKDSDFVRRPLVQLQKAYMDALEQAAGVTLSEPVADL